MKRTRIKDMSRAEDEQALMILSRMQAGHSSGDLAAQLGRNTSFARTIRNRIIAADVAESGEPEALVRASYVRGGHA